MGTRIFVLIAAPLLFASSSIAQAQQSGGSGQGEQQTQVAEQCLSGLRSFGQRTREDGYWLTGIRDRWGMSGWRWRGRVSPGYYPRIAMPPETGTTDGTTRTVVANRPSWGLGMHAPGIQIEILFRAAQVLAIRGDEQACNAVLNELTQLYGEYVSELQKAGVEPDEVMTWRQRLILAAEPVDELNLDRVSTDEITGTEIRNPEDEYLGDIEDVVISDGQIEYAVVSRGGFLGLGEDYAAVPWQRLRATPGLNVFVLDVSEATLEQAPQVSGDVRELTSEQRAEISDYWQGAAQ